MINNLDVNQIKAVNTNFKNVVICAPPGSGKTTVIINRINYLITQKNIKPKNIVVITFTRASALDMKYRYLSIMNKNPLPFFGTFHSLFYNMLKRYKGEINMVESFKVYNLISSVLMRYVGFVEEEKIRGVLNDISLFRSSSKSMEYFNSKIDKTVFIHCVREYEKYKSKNNLMDFDDLQLEVKNILETDKNILKYYNNLFTYILVDEFQDCDRLQIDILKLIGKNSSVFAVGDEDQSIYGFRGSDPICMVDFNRHFEEGQKLFLKKNYRSVCNIVKMSQNLICNNKNRNLKCVESSRMKRGNINFKIFESEKEQACYLADIIKEIIEAGKCRCRDIALLYRTNIECVNIIDKLLKDGIKFKFLHGKYNFYSHFICQDLICYFKLALDMCDKESFISIVNKPFRYIGKINIEKVRNNRVKENCFEILKNIEGVPVFQIKAIDKLQRNIKKLIKIKPKERVEFILDKLEYKDYLHKHCEKLASNMEEYYYVIEQFKQICEDFTSIYEFLKHVETAEEFLHKNLQEEDAVILSTLHGVKGMEFKNVFVINCNEGAIPHSNGILNNLEEERRLFYVGITRAIDNLYLCSTSTIKGRAVEVSRFIRECNLADLEGVNSLFNLKVGDLVVHKVFGQGKITEREDKRVSILFSDNIERSFCSSVLYRGQLSQKESSDSDVI
ncbi:ATP-dependent helicase [Clostridium kluyveri]|uniref:ATP-dependent helicase n=1 Tax=Clostridium kluyveri TaxID=1534 RepID=UPI0022472041|nr:ATP-dependent helicase [Clostridium kluyveri]UZQ51147.1 ATP-dependent helicase [Clostridium kluyveri]